MTGRYLNAHQSQYNPGASSVTRRSGCTWTSGAMGADASTGGRMQPTPDELHDLLARDEETSPTTPGWSIPDLVEALDRIGVELDDISGDGWRPVADALDAGRYVVLQGMSSVFGDQTCSGAFDGPHAIGVHPNSRLVGGVVKRWINDPICPTGRWEREDTLERYALALAPHVLAAAFVQGVPLLRPAVTWAADVLPEVRAVTSAATARSAIRRSGHEPGYVINEADLRAAMRRMKVDYGTVVNAVDLKKYMALVGVKP